MPDQPTQVARRRMSWVRRAIVEVLLVAALFNLYRSGRAAIEGQAATARGDAELVVHAEQALRLPSESTIQQLLDFETVFRLANIYYTGVHFPLMVVFLVWGFVRRPPQEYRWARNLIAIQTGGALLIHMAFPLAPPRMFPQWGFTDTMTVYGPSAYEGVSADVANQFAAMPSLHVGWAVAIAYIVFRTGPRRLAVVAAAHVMITTFVVIITANHWWLDGIVGIALLAFAVVVTRLLAARSLQLAVKRALLESAGWLLLVAGLAATPLPGPRAGDGLRRVPPALTPLPLGGTPRRRGPAADTAGIGSERLDVAADRRVERGGGGAARHRHRLDRVSRPTRVVAGGHTALATRGHARRRHPARDRAVRTARAGAQLPPVPGAGEPH